MIEISCTSIMGSVMIVILLFLNAAFCVHGTESKNKEKIPEAEMSTCQLVEYHGYPCEVHEVVTADGYILEMHRIPHGVNNTKNGTKEVAFLHHGIMDSSFTWVANLPNNSLGYLLADRGYDVWLANSRGNGYSIRHKFIKTDTDRYWDFSFDEMAKYDLPAATEYICKTTGEDQMYYIGHSQGTTIGFAGFSRNAHLAKRIKLFVALAPVTSTEHVRGILSVLSTVSPIAKTILKVLGTRNFLPSSWVVKYFSKLLCSKASLPIVCANVLFLLCGYDINNLDIDRLQVYVSHTPAGTSVRDLLHFNQMKNSKTFENYDFGWNENMHRYMQPTPPEYFIGDMKVPTALFTGSKDWLSTLPDVAAHLRHHLPNQIYDQNNVNMNHMDFVWGIHAKTLIYDNIFKLMEGKTPIPPP